MKRNIVAKVLALTLAVISICTLVQVWAYIFGTPLLLGAFSGAEKYAASFVDAAISVVAVAMIMLSVPFSGPVGFQRWYITVMVILANIATVVAWNFPRGNIETDYPLAVMIMTITMLSNFAVCAMFLKNPD